MSERKPQAAPKSPGPSRLKDSEFTLHGRNACLSAFAARPGDLLRMFFHSDRAREVSHIKKWCADHRLPYRKLEDADLRRVSGTVHHEGIVLVLRPPVLRSAYDLLDQGLGAGEFLVALDRVENTHNLGALLRTAAYFGAAGGLLSREPGQAGLAPSAARTAEGALERLPLYTCADLASLLRELKTRGVFILGASPDAADSLY
ncbi:MAG: TrmH family RNA methyltransferase, partial [Nitrospinaceae bacterium]